jgi:precorrin-6A/cobalt-precorrin-6A reductase
VPSVPDAVAALRWLEAGAHAGPATLRDV